MSSKKTKKTIKTQRINLQQYICPICKQKGQYHKDDYETICQCGLVITTPYPYVAGQRIKTLSKY